MPAHFQQSFRINQLSLMHDILQLHALGCLEEIDYLTHLTNSINSRPNFKIDQFFMSQNQWKTR